MAVNGLEVEVNGRDALDITLIIFGYAESLKSPIESQFVHTCTRDVVYYVSRRKKLFYFFFHPPPPKKKIHAKRFVVSKQKI